MQICLNKSITFKRQLLPTEEADFAEVLKRGKEKLGNTGNSILILPNPALPDEIGKNSGVGNFLNKKGVEFIDFAKQYWGINCIQTLPNGKYPDYEKGAYKPYAGTNFSLGEHLISLENLTEEEFGKILDKTDIEEIVSCNKLNNKDTFINYENILDRNSKTNEKLQKAFENLKKADTEAKKEILKEFESYKVANKEWLEPMAIYESLSKKYDNADYKSWNDFDRNFYNPEVINTKKRENAIKGIRNSDLGKEADLFEFKQYLAEKNLKKSKDLLNSKGIKLSGDMGCGFSKSEVWANPKAFIKDASIGWKLPALNLETQAGEDLLRKKVNIYAKRYDALRIDASWSYISPKIENKNTGSIIHKNYGERFLNIIDEEIQKVKGSSYNKFDTMHEFVADLKTFDIYENSKLKPFVENRNKIYTTDFMHKNWGSVENFCKRGWQKETFTIGTTNHDSKPMKIEFADNTKRKAQIEALSDILKIPKEKLETLNEFIKAKFAEPMRAKNNFLFYVDALSLDGQFKDTGIPVKDYRLKIPNSYKENYFDSLKRGDSFNIMDALQKAFVAEGLDKTESELYKKIIKYNTILKAENNYVYNSNKNKALYAVLIGLGIGVIIGFFNSAYKNRVEKSNSVKIN